MITFSNCFDNHGLAAILRWLRESFFKGSFNAIVLSTVLTKIENDEFENNAFHNDEVE